MNIPPEYTISGYTLVHAIFVGGIPELESEILAKYPRISNKDLSSAVAYYIGLLSGCLKLLVPDWDIDDFSDVLATLEEQGYFREDNNAQVD